MTLINCQNRFTFLSVSFSFNLLLETLSEVLLPSGWLYNFGTRGIKREIGISVDVLILTAHIDRWDPTSRPAHKQPLQPETYVGKALIE